MTSPPKVSACVDCGTTIIGERLRCPACHDDHAASLQDVAGRTTAPQDPVDKLSIWRVLLAWLVLVQFLAIGVLLLIFAGRGC